MTAPVVRAATDLLKNGSSASVCHPPIARLKDIGASGIRRSRCVDHQAESSVAMAKLMDEYTAIAVWNGPCDVQVAILAPRPPGTWDIRLRA